ncbi:DUF3102 domain-containing protein [Staphylococcus borealis]
MFGEENVEALRHLAHGEFGKWLEKVNISKDYSAKYIKVFDEFDNSNFATLRNIGISALHEIASLPKPERTKEQKKPPTIINSGRA